MLIRAPWGCHTPNCQVQWWLSAILKVVERKMADDDGGFDKFMDDIVRQEKRATTQQSPDEHTIRKRMRRHQELWQNRIVWRTVRR